MKKEEKGKKKNIALNLQIGFFPAMSQALQQCPFAKRVKMGVRVSAVTKRVRSGDELILARTAVLQIGALHSKLDHTSAKLLLKLAEEKRKEKRCARKNLH